jgi:hypothetical protein
MDIISYITEQGLILIPALLIIGQIIKQIPNVPNWIIPLALLIPGVIGAGALGGWTVDSIIQGVLVSGAAVYGNQIYRQVSDKRN